LSVSLLLQSNKLLHADFGQSVAMGLGGVQGRVVVNFVLCLFCFGLLNRQVQAGLFEEEVAVDKCFRRLVLGKGKPADTLLVRHQAVTGVAGDRRFAFDRDMNRQVVAHDLDMFVLCRF